MLLGIQQVTFLVQQISSLVPNYEPYKTDHTSPFALSMWKLGGNDQFQYLLA